MQFMRIIVSEVKCFMFVDVIYVVNLEQNYGTKVDQLQQFTITI